MKINYLLILGHKSKKITFEGYENNLQGCYFFYPGIIEKGLSKNVF